MGFIPIVSWIHDECPSHFWYGYFLRICLEKGALICEYCYLLTDSCKLIEKLKQNNFLVTVHDCNATGP